jgi:integral membrane sensor domain MASE1
VTTWWLPPCAGAIIALPVVFRSRAGELQNSHVPKSRFGMALTAINGAS